ncbi:hypothetical protein [Kitasatospora sp. NPDC059673]|uniref:hypothetical protein n=1 Tax=Kitasatospora sp. NPDC059673 TaxID=3346901 RepID=UPI0036993CA6
MDQERRRPVGSPGTATPNSTPPRARSSSATSALVSSIDHAVPRDQAVSGRLATARLAGKNLDGALDAASRGLDLLEIKVRSVRAVNRLTKFEGHLKRYGTEPAVGEFRERLRALPTMAA